MSQNRMYEAFAREKKARAIADLLPHIHEHYETDLSLVEFARSMGTEARDIVGAMAELRHAPSELTWELVVHMLEAREAAAALIASTLPGAGGPLASVGGASCTDVPSVRS